MTAQDTLAELLARLGANGGAAVFIGAQELAGWPAAAVAALKEQKLLVKARPAASVVCPGCERECVMPVHVIPAQGAATRSFIVCDKRSDINRVGVPIEHLERWQVSGDAVADCVARALSLRRPDGETANAGRWEVGTFKEAKYSGHLVLLAYGELRLTLAGHSMALADVLEIKDDRVVIDRRMLSRCAAHPILGHGDRESAEQRRERLKARIRAEKAAGTKAFNKVVAEEEGISVSRLKQLLREVESPAAKRLAGAQRWAGAIPTTRRTQR